MQGRQCLLAKQDGLWRLFGHPLHKVLRLRWWTLDEALNYLHQQNAKGTHERC